DDLVLLVAHGAEVSAQISQPRTCVNDGDTVRIGDLQAGSIAAELLKTGIADGDGSARTIKLELHTIFLMNVCWRIASETETKAAHGLSLLLLACGTRPSAIAAVRPWDSARFWCLSKVTNR